jgi:hypothetical protein
MTREHSLFEQPGPLFDQPRESTTPAKLLRRRRMCHRGQTIGTDIY